MLLIVCLATVPMPAGAAGVPSASVAQPQHPYAAPVAEAAQRFGMPESWLWAVMRVESGGDPRAVSPVGAMGLMQIMPDTWTGLTARYALGSDPFDVRANIHAGAAYLREMIDRYGDLATALAAYNAGPRRADAWRAGTRTLPAVTIAYVDHIVAAIGAPMVAARMPSAQALPISWRSAGLFTARERTGLSAVAAPPVPLNTTSPSSSGTDSPQPLSPANPLFIILSNRSER